MKNDHKKTSFELSLKIAAEHKRRIGVEDESEWYWVKGENVEKLYLHADAVIAKQHWPLLNLYRAYDTEELLERLPNQADITKDTSSPDLGNYWASEGRLGSPTFWADTAAEACGTLYLELLQKDVI